MDNINEVVSGNFKRIREQKRLSLDTVAKLTRVSKSMLGQIERGEVNPTISTMWKIANGMKISFSELLTRPEKDFEVVDKADIEPLIEDNGRFRNYPVFPYDDSRGFEIYYIEMDAGARLESDGHPVGTQEFITVFSGGLEVLAGDREILLKAGSSARFVADIPHFYANTSGETCMLSMVIYYSK